MARAKFPGLQDRFEQLLEKILLPGDDMLGVELRERAIECAQKESLPSEEVADLKKNFYNYVTRACDNHVIESKGGRSGYRRPFPATTDSESAIEVQTLEVQTQAPETIPPSVRDTGVSGDGAPFSPEAFLHFFATQVLSETFQSRVQSLPTTTSKTKWGNPDMLMVRNSELASITELREGNSKLQIDPSLFRKASATPEVVLSSIELKYGLDGDRRAWFSALSEAGANSGWANETWLVFLRSDYLINPDESRAASSVQKRDGATDPDVISLAGRMGINVGEIVVANDGGLEFKRHVIVEPRQSLRVADLREGRQELFLIAYRLLEEFDRDGCYLEVDGDSQKARVLLEQCYDNLCSQRDFSDPCKTLGSPIRNPQGHRNRFAPVVKGYFQQFGEIIVSDSGNVREALRAAIDEAVVAKRAVILRGWVDQLYQMRGD